MLESALKEQVKGLFESLKNDYTIEISVSDTHSQKAELKELLDDVASCSSKVNCEYKTGESLEFSILKNGIKSNTVFRAVPNGHEFTTLLLAILNMDGIGKNLPDQAIAQRIKALKGKIKIQSYISLSCTNCPDVVQAINVFAMLHGNINHEIIDGSINQEEVERLNVQAVPAIYANGKLLHVGRSSMGELLNKLEKEFGSEASQQPIEKKEYDVVVVGGGPAGVSAAIYSARKGLSVAILAEKIGGQVSETVDIENLISTPKTTGQQLSADLKKHLEEYPIDILENRLAERMEIKDGMKHIYTSLGEELITPANIIATGASWRKLNIPGESEYIGSGVAFCTHCDGPFYKGKTVVVVGGGNSGLEAAIDLAAITKDVTILEFVDEIKGDKILQDKLASLDNVTIITSAQSMEIEGDGNKVVALKYKDRKTDEIKTLKTDGVFVQIGLTANSKVFASLLKTNRIGEILIDANCRTNVAGVYAAGDVSQVPYKQIIIAMGEGSKAALSAFDDRIKDMLLSN